MHVLKLLHKQLEKTCSIHKKRLSSLIEVVETAMTTQYVTLTGLGRRLPSPIKTKHKIKKVDRLLGNIHLQKERKNIYKYLARLFIGKRKNVLVIVDWSPLAEGSYYYLIRASLPAKGRAITLYEECHRDTDHTTKKIHKEFLNTLKFILPDHCQPIIVTDAGFRNSWFTMVENLNWHWVGRVRNNTLYTVIAAKSWFKIKSLYPIATGKARQFGQLILSRATPLQCYFIFLKNHPRDVKELIY